MDWLVMKPKDNPSHDASKAPKPKLNGRVVTRRRKRSVSCRVPKERGEGIKWFQNVAAVTKSVWRGLTFPDYDMLEIVSARLGNHEWVDLVGEGKHEKERSGRWTGNLKAGARR